MVLGEVAITTPLKEEYNFGDRIVLEGYVVATADSQASLVVKLTCNGFGLENSAPVSLLEGEKMLFSTAGVAEFQLPAASSGATSPECSISAEYNGETAQSRSFTITDELKGVFTLESKKGDYRLGDAFVLRGTVFKKSGEDIIGNARVFYSRDSRDTQLLGEAKVTAGKMSFSYTFANLQFGHYSFDVEVTDTTGNKKYLKDVASFRLSNNILLKAALEKSIINPGEQVVVNGEIVTNPINPSSITINFKVGTETHSLTPTAQIFKGSFGIPTDMAADTYSVLVTVSDKYGNSGYLTLPLTVRRVATAMEVVVNKKKFKPGDVLDINVDVLDQTGKAMDELVQLQIQDPNKKDIFNSKIFSGQDVNVEFGRFSVPGFYTVVATQPERGLKDEDTVTVEQNLELSVDYADNTIFIKNQGNIPYNTPVDIVVVDKESPEEKQYVIRRDINLGPQEELGLSLAEEVPPGKYDVFIADYVQKSPNNEVTGNVIAGDAVSLEEAAERAKQSEHSFSDVDVNSDERSLGKKLSQQVSSVTGATTYTNEGFFKSSPLLMTLFIVGVIGALGLFAYKNRDLYEGTFNKMQDKRRPERSDHRIFNKSIKYNEPFGVIGKTTPEERRALVEKTKVEQEKAQKKGWFSKKKAASVYSEDGLYHIQTPEGDVHPDVVQAVIEDKGIKKAASLRAAGLSLSSTSLSESQKPQEQKKTPKVEQKEDIGFLLDEMDQDFLVANPSSSSSSKTEQKSKLQKDKTDDEPFKLPEDI